MECVQNEKKDDAPPVSIKAALLFLPWHYLFFWGILEKDEGEKKRKGGERVAVHNIRNLVNPFAVYKELKKLDFPHST